MYFRNGQTVDTILPVLTINASYSYSVNKVFNFILTDWVECNFNMALQNVCVIMLLNFRVSELSVTELNYVRGRYFVRSNMALAVYGTYMP